MQIAASELGLSEDRQLTLTGGLPFAGGPLNNYVMHSLATMTAVAREHPGDLVLVSANGGFVTKHAIGLYATEPPSRPFRHADVQDEVDRFPRRQVDGDYGGPATIEAYTVMHGADGPEVALVTALTPAGRRVLATTRDAATMTSFMADEPIGGRPRSPPMARSCLRRAAAPPDGRPRWPRGRVGARSSRLSESLLRGRPVPRLPGRRGGRREATDRRRTRRRYAGARVRHDVGATGRAGGPRQHAGRGGAPGHRGAVATVQVADGTAWLTNSPRGTLVQVSSASEAATANVDVATSGDNLVARQDGHSALVLNRSTGEIGKVDGALLRYTPQESVPGSSADLQLVAGGERAYVLDASQGHVRTYDSSDLSLVKDVPLAPGPTTAVVDSHGTLFAVNRTSGQVTVVDADGSSSRRTAGGPGSTVTLVGDQPYLVDPSVAGWSSSGRTTASPASAPASTALTASR